MADRVPSAREEVPEVPEQLDAIIYATGYNVTFPFFDAEFISAGVPMARSRPA